jgi:hypothetical protein
MTPSFSETLRSGIVYDLRGLLSCCPSLCEREFISRRSPTFGVPANEGSPLQPFLPLQPPHLSTRTTRVSFPAMRFIPVNSDDMDDKMIPFALESSRLYTLADCLPSVCLTTRNG